MDWEPCGSGRVSGTYNHTTVLTQSHLSKALHTSIFFCCSDIRWWLGEGRRPTKSFCEQNLYSMSSTIECVGKEGVWSHGRGVVPWKGCGPMLGWSSHEWSAIELTRNLDNHLVCGLEAIGTLNRTSVVASVHEGDGTNRQCGDVTLGGGGEGEEALGPTNSPLSTTATDGTGDVGHTPFLHVQ